MRLTEVCIRRPVLAWMLMAAVLLLGGLSFSRIGISQFPDVDIPVVSVSVTWEGASPSVVEHDVVEVLEEALAQVEGLKAIRSTSSQGSAQITLEFNLSRNIDLALQDAQAKIAHAQRRLPKDIDPPTLRKSNPEDFPIMWLALSGPVTRQTLSDYINFRIKDRLQTVTGVGELLQGGSLDRNVRIWIDSQKLDANQLTVAEVTAAIRKQHIELPAGQLLSGGREVNVRVLGEAVDLAAIRKLVVASRGNTPITLDQVALVEDGFEDERRLARVNGITAQGLGIKKQRGANAVTVASGVYQAIDELRLELPPGLDLTVNFDSTVFVRESVNEIKFEILLSVALTALMCWFFLGSWSSTFNVILAIPMSLFGTVAVLYFLGYTLNTFTLLGLGLAVGLVVDDAIMVLENITRHRQLGEDRMRAARLGTREIAFAALASSVAVVAIFSPVLFMDGLIGRFFLQFGIALCVAVMLSYLEAVTLAPARCAQFLNVDADRRTLIGRMAEWSFSLLERLYETTLKRTQRHPWLVVIAALGLFIGSLAAFRALPNEQIPTQDQSRLSLRLQAAVGSSLDETDHLVKRVEAFVNERPEVARTFTVLGNFGNGGGVNTAGIFITMVSPSQRTLSQKQFEELLRKELKSFAGLKIMIQDPSQQSVTAQRGNPVEASLRGPDWDTLIKINQDFTAQLRTTGLLVDLDSDTQLGMPELRVTPDRARCADLGVAMEDVATALNILIGGQLVGKFSGSDRRMDIRARLLADQRTRGEDLQRLRVRTRSGELVPLSSLITTVEVPAVQEIRRANRERSIGFFANVAAGHSQEEALREIERLGKELPAGYRVVLSGASASFREVFVGLLIAAFLGIVVAYMVLAAQFNSFLHPITVLMILPLALGGAATALWLGGQTLNMFSVIGLLLLMGIAKKNSIILVDYANQLRASDKLDAASAMLRAGPVRLRPILMTSGATLLAAVPLAIGMGPGSETRAPMAIAIIGGVLVSTALSLIVVPAFYLLADRFAQLFRSQPHTVER